MGLSGPWFIESWSVLDGIAFASLRENEDIRVCVALMPPDWRAVPIGNPSTAWTAARFGFQEGLFFPDGTEVAFPDLDVIRELVRRAYIAGGLGLADPAAEASVVAPPEGLDSSGAAELLLEYDGEEQTLEEFVKTHLQLLHEVLNRGAQKISRSVQWWEKSHAPLHVRLAQMRNLNAWRHHLHPANVLLEVLPGSSEVSAMSATALLFSLPALNPKSLERVPAPRSLGDQLLLASASRAQCKRMRDPSQLIALLVAADLLTAASLGRAVHPHDSLSVALRWLAGQVPNNALASVKGLEELMEELIADIAIFRLTPHKRTNPTGTPNRSVSAAASLSDDSHAQGAPGA